MFQQISVDARHVRKQDIIRVPSINISSDYEEVMVHCNIDNDEEDTNTLLVGQVDQPNLHKTIKLNKDQQVLVTGQAKWWELRGLQEPSVYNPITELWEPWSQVNKE